METIKCQHALADVLASMGEVEKACGLFVEATEPAQQAEDEYKEVHTRPDFKGEAVGELLAEALVDDHG